MRRTLGVLVAVVALVGAFAATRVIAAQRVGKSRVEAAHSAANARQRTADGLRQQLESMQNDAMSAAQLQPLISLLGELRRHPIDDQVGATVMDFFRTELSFETYRNKYAVQGLSAEGNRLQVMLGMKAQGFGSEELIQQARDRGRATGTVLGKDWPYAAAAAQVVVPGLGKPVILVLARPFDEGLLREIAERAGGAVLISDGARVLAKSGSPQEIALLSTALGHEKDAEPPVDPEGAWGASALPLGPRLWLWTHASALAAAREAQSSASTTQTIAWLAAAVLAGGSLFFGFRRPGPPMVSQPALTAPVPPGTGPSVAGATLPATGGDVSGLGSTLQASTPPPNRPSNGVPFGRYLLLERLGEGGMAQVFTAVTFGAEGFRRKFVVKRLRPELSNDAAVVAQFIDEANLASTMVHSNIVPVFDFGKQGSEYYLATEYILGRDLGRIVRRMVEVDRHHLPLELALLCAHETLKALEYAHTKTGEGGQPLGIVHRDVSPNNVLVSARGEVKLFDFGIVKAEGRVTKTQHGVVKGNVSFMSPEQARGVDIDARADLFSLGLVLFYCLTGEVLYQGGTTYDLLLKAATGPGPDERARIAALPAPAAAIVARAVEVDPARRYQSAGEFAAVLAPHVRASGNDLAGVMQRLFSEEFRQEEKRFADAFPASQTPGATPPQLSSRRT
ncbi:MAG TPA: serine/threonine-protein kinase [Polyangia bacterium]|nr:serine/threonine-protein kinase [Polyangia bacterium]